VASLFDLIIINSMPMTRSTSNYSNITLRSELAHEAARLVAEGEAPNFASAKRKASANLGIALSRNLPDNLEVQQALIDYLKLFEGERYHLRIQSMRCEALAAMQVFEQFSPRLVGPVLHGSAVSYSPITMHLYTDELESVTRFLHDSQINYQLDNTRLKISRERYEDFPTYWVINQEREYELVVFSENFITHPPLSALDGRRYRRVDVGALRRVIDESEIVERFDATKEPDRSEP
jgi:hypothetical protein